jgi:aspartyl-tRNA(Asn)/glutamyl-tRNA(Gln) amidotransferase subunit A
MLLDLSIKELSTQLRNNTISPKDLLDECYANIEKNEKHIHAFITLIHKKDALKQIKKQTKSPLYGLPYVMKDAYITKGIRTTAASNVLDTFIPPYNATVYQKLEEAGAICIGKMNMDAWGHGASTENTDFPVTKNPWDTSRSAGGSGGGPAAAIAARFCVFGIGEDTGGSIRNPAAWNNISAMKVTYGRVSRYGAIAYASSLDTVGPTAKTAEDCAFVLEAIAGHDPLDATSSQKPIDKYTELKVKSENLPAGKAGFKIAVSKEFLEKGIDNQIREAMLAAIEKFRSLGIIVEEISLPILEYAVPLYYILAPSETSSNLGRYDGVRYGAGRENFTKETIRRIMTGTYALSSGYYDAYYKKAQKARTLFIQKYTEVLKKYDAILSPVNPAMPPKFGELLDDPLKNMMADIFTVTVNIVGVPSLAIPCGFSDAGLPIGMQLIGNMFSEQTLFTIGRAYQAATEWHTKKPNIV